MLTTENWFATPPKPSRLAQARYQTGISSIVELSEAQLNLTSAQIADAGARYNVLIQQASLDYQTGTLN